MKIENWCELNRFEYSLIDNNSNLLQVDQKSFVIIKPKQNVLFDEDFNIILDDVESELINKYIVENYLFEFGGYWYFSVIDKAEIELIPFKYLGKAKLQQEFDFPYLGIHGKYDLCNGSRDYKDWIKKAKFLNIDTLGICETNTLAGTLAFQLTCKELGMKSIIGEEVFVRDSVSNEEFFVKLYVMNNDGWRNLLLINTEINVHNHEQKFIEFDRLTQLSSGLVCATSYLPYLNTLKTCFKHLYFQIDTVEYLSDEKDKEHLLNLKNYVDHYVDLIEPILINDSFYLDKEDSEIKLILNKIGKINSFNQSHDQYFKSTDDILCQLITLFKEEDDRLELVVNKALLNLIEIKELCDFSIEVNNFHLPEYKMTSKESLKYKDNEDLFWFLIQQEFGKKIEGKVEDENIYLDRIEKEVSVIKKGGFIDYFLILWDVVNWCNEQNILTGVGRGSAAGSLIAYLLGLVKVDPIKYDLIFERFLNESRLSKSLPDIDLDFPGNKRDEIKKYIETKYGSDYVTSLGTYSTLKMRAALKDLGRVKGLNVQTLNYFTAMIDPESSFTELFKKAVSTPILKKFLQDNVELINNIQICFEQPKSKSVHASGVVIVPKNKNIYSWIPVRKENDNLVTEWEGGYIDKAGFLKCDILGIKQLEKFKNILDLIKHNTNKTIILEDIPLDQEEVYDLFRLGLTEDVFQFGAQGLKGYCKVLKPDNIEDLIATVALYRPGPMEIGAHIKYARIKNGESYPEYLPGTKEITQSTYSNIVYEEQVMAICVSVGGFNLTESDDIRRAMKKGDISEMEKYKSKFIKGAISIKYNTIEANKLWNSLESFTSYAFNRSHATSYAFTGYYCQWFKYNYPLEFWITALKYSKDDELPSRINEINKISEIKLLPPDVNYSQPEFYGDIENNKIYWSLNSVKFISEKASESILTEREKGGNFTSIENFKSRVNKRVVNKRVIFNLILCGAFDQLYNIPLDQPEKRYSLIKDFCLSNKEEVPGEYNKDTIWKSYFFTLKQKQLCGLGYIDFEKIYKSNNIKEQLINEDYFFSEDVIGNNKCIGGIIHEIIERNSQKGKFAQIVINSNNQIITCIIWNEIWEIYKEQLNNNKEKIIFITGEIKYDPVYRQKNVLQANKSTKIVII